MKLGKKLDYLHHTKLLIQLSEENNHIYEDQYTGANGWDNWMQIEWFFNIFNSDFRVWI